MKFVATGSSTLYVSGTLPRTPTSHRPTAHHPAFIMVVNGSRAAAECSRVTRLALPSSPCWSTRSSSPCSFNLMCGTSMTPH